MVPKMRQREVTVFPRIIARGNYFYSHTKAGGDYYLRGGRGIYSRGRGGH